MKKLLIALGVVSFLLPQVTFAATAVKIDTSKKFGFSLKRPSTWATANRELGRQYSEPTSTDPKLASRLRYVTVEKHGPDAAFWSPDQSAALKKGWPQFVTQFVKDYKAALGPSEIIPTDRLISVTQTAYGLNGYKAAIITSTGNSTVLNYREAVVLVTKDGKRVYQLTSHSTALRVPLVFPTITFGGETIEGFSTTTVPLSPLDYNVRALFQSFRIL